MISIASVCLLGHNLKICQSNLTCCSKQMESELYMRSSRVLENAVYDQTNATHHFLTTQASLFDGKSVGKHEIYCICIVNVGFCKEAMHTDRPY